jgi:hypothetical protein
LVNHLLSRPLRDDWQFRVEETIRMQSPAPAPIGTDKAEKLARAKELYIAGDISKNEYMELKTRMDVRADPPGEIINTTALLGVINVPSAAWETAKPESRRFRNRLLLRWARIERVNKARGEHFIHSYELTDLGKAVLKE